MINNFYALKLPNGEQVTPPPNFITPSPEVGLAGIIQWVILILTIIGIAAALIFLIWGAIKWITSGGDKEKLAGARSTILHAIIGFIIVLLSVVIVQFIGGLLGVKLLNLPTSESSQNANERRNDNNRNRNQRSFDCPDGSNTYSCGETSDTQCPLCSHDPKCNVRLFSIAECSHGPGCTENSQCPEANCNLGEKSASYCSQEGFCVSHCLPDDYQIQE